MAVYAFPHSTLRSGRLWESAVKSANLLRTIGETCLTYEQLCTALARVETCLNSRPLQSLFSYPKDLDPLIPGHFFTRGPTIDLIYPDITDVKVSCLSRFQLLQAYSNIFGKDGSTTIYINNGPSGRTRYRRPLKWARWSCSRRKTYHRCDGG